MKKAIFITVALVLITVFTVDAQKIKLENGSLDFLLEQESLLVKYDYSNVAVGKYDNEAEYIADKVEEYNEDEAGKGDEWKEAWLSDRPNRFEPKFEEIFNETIDPIGLQCSQTTEEATYEVIVHTIFVEPGFNVGVARKNASIDVEMVFNEIATGNEMAVLIIEKCPGRGALGFDYDTGYRIQEAYAMLGKSVARFIMQRIK